MRASQYLIATLKETPADAEVISHQLMLRAGMIRKLAAGLYSWLPLGLRVLRRVERIVREEMDRAGAQEVLMPAVQPAELWEESGRWEQFGPEMLRLNDRHQRSFCFGPTHEEVITDLIRRELRSYRQLPANFYQIQTKFRDEVRPRFGVMRAREFLMKDAYSFHLDETSLQQTYQVMHATYSRIFERLGLDFRAVEADTGAIGGSASHEFHVLADSGEDAIAFATGSSYAANVELAPALPPSTSAPPPTEALREQATPRAHTIADLVAQFQHPAERIIKTLLVHAAADSGSSSGLVALLLRGDHELNPLKAERLPQVAQPLQLADEAAIRAAIGAGPGSLGPVGLTLPCIADHAVMAMSDFCCGANRDGYHLFGVNWARDLPPPITADLRNVVDGDPSPDGCGTLEIRRGIEVGHIFQLGRKYSAAMNATVQDEQGQSQVLTMGCYGIGVSRLVAAAIEQNHDQHGIIWPASIAPFDVVLCPIGANRSVEVGNAAEALYQQLQQAGFSVLFDDRGERPGVMFADMELMGIPHRLVISARGIEAGMVEYKGRRDSESRQIAAAELIPFLQGIPPA